MSYVFRRFLKSYFPEYRSWFTDPELNARLGPMEEDDAWLDAVMTEKDGCQYAVFQGETMVAVIGMKFPKPPEYPAYYITELAVRPDLRGQGIGAQVLRELMRLHPTESGQTWRAFINQDNPKALAFF